MEDAADLTAVELDGPIRRRDTFAWILYDLANTIYAATVTYLLIDYVAGFEWGGTAAGVAQTLGMVSAGLLTPVFASLADHTGKAHAYCAAATLGCIAAMSGFGAFADSPAPLLACFFVSTMCYQAALTFYNSLLPSVAETRRTGLVSGLGVGFGYLGNLFTLMIAVPVQIVWGLRVAFFVTAAGFLAGALPMMLLVRDRRRLEREPISRSLIRKQFGVLVDTIRRLPERKPLMWFLIGNFAAVDVLNTAILFFAAFVTKSFEPMAEAGELVLMGHVVETIEHYKMIAGLMVTLGAFASAIVLGFLADLIGSTRAFLLSVVCLAGGLGSAALFAGSHPLAFIVVMCGLGGLGLAGIWTAGRKLLIELVPPRQVGRYFGLYGITIKVSVIGSTVFGFIMDSLGPGPALFGLVFPLLLTFFCIFKMARAIRSAAFAVDRIP